MKRIFSLSVLFILTLTLSIYAQSPEKFNYQAIVRDQSGNVISNKSISLRISILKGSTFGTFVFVEKHSPKTNKYGIVNIVIGEGTLSTGSISEIDWSDGPYYIKMEIDASGGESYSEIATTQLISVPYSLYSNKSDYSKTSDSSKISENVMNVDYGQLTNKPDLSVFQPITSTEAWDKVSDDDVRLTGDQKVNGKKTFGDSLIVENTLKSTINSVSGKAIFGENNSETGLVLY